LQSQAGSLSHTAETLNALEEHSAVAGFDTRLPRSGIVSGRLHDRALPTTMSSDPAQARGNPLLARPGLPKFSAIRARDVEPAVRATLDAQRRALRDAESASSPTTAWLQQLELIHEAIHRVWSPVSHLNAVASSPELRDAYNRCLGLVTEFDSELGQSEALYNHFVHLEPQAKPGGAQAQLVRLALRDLRLAGVALSGEAKQQFRSISQTLAQRQAAFEQNLLDATDAFELHVEQPDEVAGLPRVTVGRAREAAAARGIEGWLLSLDPPTYTAVMSHAKHEPLRKQFHEAWVTRASDRGPNAGRWDNAPLIEEILALRHESARLLGYASYAELSLATKMAASVPEVLAFLDDLAARSHPMALEELEMLSTYAGRSLAPWDLAFYGERLKKERFHLSEEELRPYFPLQRVLEGLFWLTEKLFGLRITEQEFRDKWHPDVRYYRLSLADGREAGGLFTDMFTRPNKRGGAWMDGCLNRAALEGLHQLPVAHLVCNFNPPLGSEPSLLTHRDVVTLFHEFGHALHHLLTEVDYPSIAGINGVPWDAVELPSQFFENYAWLPGVLRRISAHVDSGEPLPEEQIKRMNASRTFLSGLAMVRQLEFALFDFRLHCEGVPASGARVLEVLSDVRRRVAVLQAPAYDRFPSSFAHIFGGGYAAGYYSYKWAEVLAADAFSAFEETDSLDSDTADRFRRCILAVGGSRDALQAFVDFRGRAPKLDPLLRQCGITRETPGP
jgi:oligopeptidase A